MATMTHPMMNPAARGFHRSGAANNIRATVASDELKGSIMYGVGMAIGIVGVALMTVLTPFLGPPAAEVAALNQAKEVQGLAQSWVVIHPEAAVPTGDARAWGLYDPSAGSSADEPPCTQFWAGSAGAC